MAITTIVRSADMLKGPRSVAAPLNLIRFDLYFTGTYATGGAVNADLCVGIAAWRQTVTAINVLWACCYGDLFDTGSGATWSVDNTSLALGSGGAQTSISAASTNNLVTVARLTTGINGVGGAEIANATPVNGDAGLICAVVLTFGSLGTA